MTAAASTQNGPAARGEMPPASLSDAFRRNVFTKGYVVHLAGQLGISAKDLYRYCTDPDNASDEHREPPASLIVPLTIATARFDVLDFLEDQVGRVACPRPVIAGPAGALLEKLAGVTREVADVQRAGADLLDGATAIELRVLDKQISEAQTALQALRLVVMTSVQRRPLTKTVAR